MVTPNQQPQAQYNVGDPVAIQEGGQNVGRGVVVGVSAGNQGQPVYMIAEEELGRVIEVVPDESLQLVPMRGGQSRQDIQGGF